MTAAESPSPNLVVPPHPGADRPDTPSSATPGSRHQQQQADSENGDQNPNDGSDPKRSRACEACRGLKVRCEPDPGDQGPCKRCRKAGRKCIVTAPTRKRQKKTDNRVSELEKKIDALTASLQARGPAGGPAVVAAAAAAPPVPSRGNSPGGGEASASPMVVTSRQRSSMDEPGGGERLYGSDATRQGSMGAMGPQERASSLSAAPARREQPPAFQPPVATAGMKRKASERKSAVGDDHGELSQPTSTSPPWVRGNQGDIVDRGLITMDVAADLFSRYTERMAPHLPAVVFPPSTTASELRRSKPILFLAVMAAAGSEMHALQKVVQKELMGVFAEKVFLTGDKSLEIVQALLVSTIWYWPPEHFEELKFYQLIHTAAVMAIDIGLGKKAHSRRTPTATYSWQTHPFRRFTPPDPTTIESRRTWLGCFFLASNASMALHRPNLIRWSSFMAECVDILESSPDAAPTDSYFCRLVLQHKLGEEVGGQFSLDDPANVVDINDPRTQYALKALERDLEKYQNTATDDMMRPSLKIGYNMISLYMHEVALHNNTAADQLRPPFNTDAFKDSIVGSEPLSSSHINAISACLTAIDGIFTTFLNLDVAEIRCLPVYNFVRVAYGIVILVKMYFSASSPSSELGKVINKSNLRVESYLDALIEKFRLAAAEDRSRPAAKFIVVLVMLKSWFTKQEKEDGKGGGGGSSGQDASPKKQQTQKQPPPEQQHQKSQQQGANTPLQLLSEVAAGSDSGGTRCAFSRLTGLRQVPQPFFHDSATPSSATSSEVPQQQQQQIPFSDPSSTWTPQQPMPMDMTLADPSLGLDFSSMGFDPGSQEDGARIMLAEPWFSDVFQGFQSMQDPDTMFPF